MHEFLKSFVTPDSQPVNYRPDQIDTLYRAALGFYQTGDYQKGVDMFISLIPHAPFEERMWRGLASSHQMLKDYPAALCAWGAFCKVAKEPAIGFFHAAECFASLGRYEEAKKALSKVKS